MKKFSHPLSLIAFALLMVGIAASSCSKKQKVHENVYIEESVSKLDTLEKPDVVAITVDEMADVTKLGAQYEIIDVKVEDDTLMISIKYGGGCEVHTFDLISKGAYAESEPPQLMMYLKHNDRKDKCRQLLFKTLRTDLRSIRYPGSNSVEIGISNWEGRVLYTYE